MVTPGASDIAGTGLFAGRQHAAGSLVIALDREPQTVGDLGLLNHSCDPNLGWLGPQSLIAVRDIADGDELTVDYAASVDDPDLVLFCHCETYRCRQVIEGRDWQIPQLQERYTGYWAPAVQRKVDGAAR